MEPITQVEGRAYPFGRANIDTDLIIPAAWLKTVTREGLGRGAFEAVRAEPGNVFDDPAYAGSPIIVAGDSFGCGSSREHAAWALLEAGVGLWDTVASATRRGSLDAAIREAEHNPLADLAATLPQLRAVAFNGATSAKIGTALLARTSLALLPLPSSSPAYAAMPYAEKARLWRQIGEFLS